MTWRCKHCGAPRAVLRIFRGTLLTVLVLFVAVIGIAIIAEAPKDRSQPQEVALAFTDFTKPMFLRKGHPYCFDKRELSFLITQAPFERCFFASLKTRAYFSENYVWEGITKVRITVNGTSLDVYVFYQSLTNEGGKRENK